MSTEDFTVNESDSRDVLDRLRMDVFKGDDEAMAIALGRPFGEIEEWLEGGEIDEDAQMKINGIAKERLSGE